jgi:DNA repair protein RecO
MHLQTPAIVLRAVDYKDADKILTVLTAEEGKRTVSARGCRRKGSKLAAQCQHLVYSEMSLFTYKERLALEEAATLQEFRHLRADLFTLALGIYFAEVVEAVAEEGRADPGLMSLLLNSLYAIDMLKKPPELVKACFEMRLICLAGYEPVLDGCAICGEEPKRPMLDVEEGILHCESCPSEGRSLHLDPAALAAMRHTAHGDAKRLFSISLPSESLTLFAKVSERFLLTQLERGFHTLDYYKSLNPSV